MHAYTVTADFTDAAVADEWITWLRDEHLAEVLASPGCLSAEVIRFHAAPDPMLTRCEVRYHFTDREAFAAYERNHAPRLREEGLKHFPTSRGITYARSTGDVMLAKASSHE